MPIEVIHPGLMTTIQDLGRFGAQKYGVIVSGPMDTYSFRIANILVGNKEQESAIEMTLLGATLKFTEDCLIALTGGDFKAKIDGKLVPMWRPVFIRKGSILKCGPIVKGCRSYLAIVGGIDVPLVMNSKSTYMRAKIGGFRGRALKKKDRLSFGEMTSKNQKIFDLVKKETRYVSWSANRHLSFSKPQIIRVLPGTEFKRFDASSQQNLYKKTYTITTQSDRMGYRLSGESLTLSESFNLLSEGVTFGTIQVPSNGQPIILMADHQTTGGYPKIGQVISADLPKLAQLQPNATVQFQRVTMAEAERAFFDSEKIIRTIERSICLKSDSYEHKGI